MSCAKAAEPIETPFGYGLAIGRDLIPTRERALLRAVGLPLGLTPALHNPRIR